MDHRIHWSCVKFSGFGCSRLFQFHCDIEIFMKFQGIIYTCMSIFMGCCNFQKMYLNSFCIIIESLGLYKVTIMTI